jgi:hypothetical protein
VELAVAIIAFITRIRDINTELVKRLVYLGAGKEQFKSEVTEDSVAVGCARVRCRNEEGATRAIGVGNGTPCARLCLIIRGEGAEILVEHQWPAGTFLCNDDRVKAATHADATERGTLDPILFELLAYLRHCLHRGGASLFAFAATRTSGG